MTASISCDNLRFYIPGKTKLIEGEEKTNCTSNSIELREFNISPRTGESCLKATCFVCIDTYDKYL